MERLYAAKPVTSDRVLEIAREVFAGYVRQLNGFAEWFDKNQDYLLTRING